MTTFCVAHPSRVWLAGTRIFIFLCLSNALSARAEESYSIEDRQKLLEQYYTRAIQFYNEGNYSRAIASWNEILKIDEEQSTAKAMIQDARAKLSSEVKPKKEEMRRLVLAGEYRKALGYCEILAESDPSNAHYKILREKLQGVIRIIASAAGEGKGLGLIRKAMAAHLAEEDNPRLSLNAIRYAKDLNPGASGYAKLVVYMEAAYHEAAAKDKVTPGLSVVEQKLLSAVNHIYEGRYDLAIFDCDEVLELEPASLLALKRKGSAYFQLNKKEKARAIWQQALSLSPKDTEIKQFLAQK